MRDFEYISYNSKKTKVARVFLIIEFIASLFLLFAFINSVNEWIYPDIITDISFIVFSVAIMLSGIFSYIKARSAKLPDAASEYEIKYIDGLSDRERFNYTNNIKRLITRAEMWKEQYFKYCVGDEKINAVIKIVWAIILLVFCAIDMLA